MRNLLRIAILAIVSTGALSCAMEGAEDAWWLGAEPSEEGKADDVTWVIEQGAVGGVPLLGFAFGCAANADCIVPSPQQFTYFQGGGFDQSLLSFLEIDAQGNVNVSKLAKRPYLTAGCGGFVLAAVDEACEREVSLALRRTGAAQVLTLSRQGHGQGQGAA